MFYRSFYYLRIAVSIVGFPFSFLTFLSVFYEYIDFLPFEFYLALSISVALVTLPLFGYYWRKHSGFYKAERDIDISKDPYTTSKVTPNTVTLWEPLIMFLEKQGMDCSKVKRLLANSGEN